MISALSRRPSFLRRRKSFRRQHHFPQQSIASGIARTKADRRGCAIGQALATCTKASAFATRTNSSASSRDRRLHSRIVQWNTNILRAARKFLRLQGCCGCNPVSGRRLPERRVLLTGASFSKSDTPYTFVYKFSDQTACPIELAPLARKTVGYASSLLTFSGD